MTRPVIPTAEIQEKLRDLRNLFPGHKDLLYLFAERLAERLNPQLSAGGLHATIETLFQDVQRGISTFPDKSVEGLTDQHSSAYYITKRVFLERVIPLICPEDFVEDFNAWDEIMSIKV
tara:strand:- start:473 stop:829 length:357 start_codon:yes stop_codon:yes gene_type:complete